MLARLWLCHSLVRLDSLCGFSRNIIYHSAAIGGGMVNQQVCCSENYSLQSKHRAMEHLVLEFDETGYRFPFVQVNGTGEGAFLFGLENDLKKIRVKDFFISRYPVTQMLWQCMMNENPSASAGHDKPVTNVSYNELHAATGFLEKINQRFPQRTKFRLPAETEWEYAARGGPYWRDWFVYSGSDNIDEAGWYKRNSGNDTKTVGLKKPNQLGIYDMCGNVWEWCWDNYQEDTGNIPNDGSPCLQPGEERVLRGGCFHNGGIHCTVMKRYAIEQVYKDPCIGFRVVLPAG